MDKNPESSEIPKTLKRLLEILQKGFSKYTYKIQGKNEYRTIDFTFEIAEHEQPIILTDSEYTFFLKDLIQRPFPEESSDTTKYRRKLAGYKFTHIDSNKTGLKNAIKITAPDGENLYIIAKSEYPKIKQTGVQNKNVKVQNLVDKYFEKHETEQIPPEEHIAAKVITGDIEYIAPLLTGLKPAGVMKIDDDLKKILKISELKTVQYKEKFDNEDETEQTSDDIVFNPEAVVEMVSKNPEIFSIIGVDDSMPPEKIIEKTIGLENSLTESKHEPEITKAVGLLLGFDKASVIDYENLSTKNEKMYFGDFNIWSVQYVVKEGQEFEELKSKYDNLQKTIIALLSEGLRPLEVIKRLPIIEKQKTVRKQVTETVNSFPKGAPFS